MFCLLNLFCNLTRLVFRSRPLLFFISCTLKGTGFKRKNKVNFLKVFRSSSFKISFFFLKEFLAWNARLGYLPELKRGSGLTFSGHFLYKSISIYFPWKYFLFNTLLIDKFSMSCLFSFSSRYQTKCVIKFLFRQLITS